MADQQFDVFLAHSSKDKPLIRQIYRQLKARGINPWLDEEEIAPGTKFQDEIQQAIGQIKTAAICFGRSGLGRWQTLELKAFITQCVERDIPVIPVLLPGVNEIPEDLLFLREFHAVTFNESIEDERAFFFLEWGVTGQKPTEKTKLLPIENPVIVMPVGVEELKSDEGIDYTRLRNFLKAGSWRAADLETGHRMLEAVGRVENDWIRPDELRKFPCADLKTIDSLWKNYSDGKFGFSLQKAVWQECGSPISSGEEWDRFCVQVGWQDSRATRYLSYPELQADPNFSPQGEFPFFSFCWNGSSLLWMEFVVLDCVLSLLAHKDL